MRLRGGADRLSRAAAGWIAACLLASGSPAGAETRDRAFDVFDALQQNTWYLRTADGKARLYVTSLGEGPAVVVLHGGPGNDFHYLVGALRGQTRSHRFILFDQRGSLLSPVPEGEVAKLTLKTLVEDLETLRAALGEERLVLFGHSFGTLLAMAYYQAYPERVAGLVLSASVPPHTESFADLMKRAHERLRALRERPAVQAALREAGVAEGKLTPRQQSIRFRIEGLAAFNLYHVDRWRQLHGGGVYYNSRVDDAIGNSIAPEHDVRPALRRFPVPITVIQGDHDYVDPAAGGWETLARDEPRVRIHVIRKASHYSWVDDPNAFRRALADGLQRALARSREPGSR